MDDFKNYLLAHLCFDEAAIGVAEQGGAVNEPLYYKLRRHYPDKEREIWAALSNYLQINLLDPHKVNPDSGLSKLIPIKISHDYSIVPIGYDGRVLQIALADPRQFEKCEEYSLLISREGVVTGEFGTGLTILPHLARPSDITALSRIIYGFGAEMIHDMIQDDYVSSTPFTTDRAHVGSDGSIILLGPDHKPVVSSSQQEEDAAIIRYVNQLLMEAVRTGASDIHIEPFEDRLRIRFRLDGMLQSEPVPENIKNLEPAIISRVKIMANLDIAEKRLPQDGQIRLHLHGRPIDIRVSTLPTMFGQGIALRILDRQMAFIRMDNLGMEADYLSLFRSVLTVSHGIILVTGPTGSGKTTTLYAVLNEIDHDNRKLITVEDPIEYQLEGVSQIQVNNQINLSFANILRNILRHDPDVIMVGEIRDHETAQIAVSAAMTGHLVFSTLHTNDAPSAPVRLMEMGVEPYLIASSLEAVVAQRLIRILCQHCRKPVMPETIMAGQPLLELKGSMIFEPVGCPECRHTGFKGRSAIFEMFTLNNAIRQLIIGQSNSALIKQEAMAAGLRTLHESGMMKVKQGLTSLGEVYRVARNDSHTMKEFMGKKPGG